MTFANTFVVGDRSVGSELATYVVAEIGSNHNRDLGMARELIMRAAEAGADAVKFQTYSGRRIYSSKTPRFRYLEPITDKTPAELLEEIELPREWQPILMDYAREYGVDFFSTPFDADAVHELAALDVPMLKIASFEIVDLPLIRLAASTGKPLIISTGMATLGEIEDALGAARDGGASAVALLQCVSLYPAPPSEMNLRAMATLRSAFEVPVGLSDHTVGVAVPIAAAAMGAAIVEKHFTLDRSLPGPDHPFAIEPLEFKAMVDGIHDVLAAQGSGVKAGPSALEREEMFLARRSLVASRALQAGTVLQRDMITTKRPGTGIPPKYLDVVLGRILRADVDEDDVLTWSVV